jgi:hypothetical protein
MKQNYAAAARLAWEDRWSQPTVDQLLDPLNPPHKRVFTQLMEHLESLDRVQKTILWYGDAWKWTLQYNLLDAKGHRLDTVAYLVPKADGPLICVPFADDQIERLPMRRLPKIVREGIRAAKCALSTHWATWQPSQASEAVQLTELVKRRHKILVEPADPKNN